MDNLVPFSQDREIYFRLALKHALRKDYNRALAYVEMAIERDAYNAEYLFNKSCMLVELKRTREAIKLLHYIIWNIDPTYSECYFCLGCNYFEIGNYEKALLYFDKYIMTEDDGEFFDDAYDILHYMRMAGDETGFDFDNQYDLNESARKRSRDCSEKLRAAGSMYLRRGKYKEAIRQFKRSIVEYPETKNSRLRLSMAYYMNGQLALAKLLAGSVLKIQKGNHMAKLCLALYYSTEGMTDETDSMLGVFKRRSGKRRRTAQDDEDRSFYEQMLVSAPVGDDMKHKLRGASELLH